MHPSGVIVLVGFGGILAYWCEESARHSVGRLAVITLCWGVQFAAILIGYKYLALEVLCALLFLYYAWSTFARFRTTTRERILSVTPPTADPISKVESDVALQFKLPMMPIRDMVIVPHMMTPFVVGRDSSVRALEYALANDQKIFLATQHEASNEEPKANQISQFGCVCKILQNVKMPNGHVKILVEGTEMAKTIGVDESCGFFIATVRSVNTDVGVA